MKNPGIAKDYEISIYQYGLIIGLIIMGIRVTQGIVEGAPYYVTVSHSIIFGALISLRFFGWRSRYGVFAYHLFICFAVISSWEPAGGWSGRVPYVIIAIYIFIIATTHGKQMVATLALFTGVIFSLTWTYSSEIYATNLFKSLSFEFLLQTVFLGVLIGLMKFRFFSIRQNITNTTEELDKMERLLTSQLLLVEKQNEELIKSKESLQDLVQSKNLQVEDRVEKMRQFSFINSHVVRAPIARILSLLNILEQDEGRVSVKAQRIKESTLKIDSLTKRLNKLVNAH